MELKVYGSTMIVRDIGGPHSQARVIFGGASWRAFSEATGRPLSDLRSFGSVSGNKLEVAQAAAQPGVPLARPINSFGPYRLIGGYPVLQADGEHRRQYQHRHGNKWARATWSRIPDDTMQAVVWTIYRFSRRGRQRAVKISVPYALLEQGGRIVAARMLREARAKIARLYRGNP